MKLYSIMPMFLDHVEEICDDIERQYNEGIATEALFMFTLTPEGNPAVNKAAMLCEKYDVFKKELNRRGINAGVLVQATIGHGYSVGVRPPFQNIVAVDGTPSFTICPFDEDFRDYLRDAFAEIAKRNPSSIMVDDDFRLFARSNHACACPLHLKEISRKFGREISREELESLMNGNSDESKRLVKIYYETNIESLVGCAKAMREGIDSVDPTIPGSFCNCGDNCEGAAEIAKILAGEGNPVIVRINNGNYSPAGARGVADPISRCATQISAMSGSVDVFLAETDTCPQNRYSTGAHSLHTHFTASILEGAGGCKHWITRLAAYEPKSGEAYRKILAEYSGYYNALSDIVPKIKWHGARIPLTKKAWEPTAPICNFKYPSGMNSFARCVLERLGLPFYYSSESGGAVFLDGERDALFGDDEIKEMLKGDLFLAADTAKRLANRGFGEYIGVSVEEIPADDNRASVEIILENGNPCSRQMRLSRLVPTSEKTVAHSWVVQTPNGAHAEPKIPLFPGVTSYKNVMGGNVVVFAGTPEARFVYTEAFSFLNESRKLQLISLLKESGELMAYYPGDQEVYVKAGELDTGELFVAFFNISLDPMEDIQLVVDRKINSVKLLFPSGEFKDVSFQQSNAEISIDAPAPILSPQMIILG